jgi:PPOX class probable F420-dependent enzyme
MAAQQTQVEPTRTRPNMPKYGIDSGSEGMLSWEWVNEQMEKSRNYWICSTRPDGRPHAAPVWGVWMDGILYFSTSRSSRKGRNLVANPEVVVHLESGDDTVIFEGVVEEVTDAEKPLRDRLGVVYASKYGGFNPEDDPNPENVMYRLRPQVAYSWLEKDFVKSATRWLYNEA